MRNSRRLSAVLFGSLLALGSATPVHSAEDKGIQKCRDDRICFGINPTASQPSVSDIDLQYRYSGPDGVGKGAVLDNGSTLKSGDKFTIALEAREPRYVYLFHFDSNGQLNELLSLSGKRNKVEAGSKLVLPAADQHFLLDDKTGVETIHTIVSKTELVGLWEKYNAILKGGQEQRPMLTAAATRSLTAVAKGICVRNDGQNMDCPGEQAVAGAEPPAPPGKPPVQAQGGRTVICMGGEACRDSFSIRHVAR